MIERRSLLRGLFAMPAIVVVSSLMPIRGVILRPDIIDPNEMIRLLNERLDIYCATQPAPFARFNSYQSLDDAFRETCGYNPLRVS